jgi:hypothetical protein
MSSNGSEPKLFDIQALENVTYNSEWVTLSQGQLCVRELSAADKLFVMERSQRPTAPGASPTIDAGSVLMWQIIVSCYDGPGKEARRVFEMKDLPLLQQMRGTDWERLIAAIERVNAVADTEVSAREAFTTLPAASFPGI